MKDFQNGQDLKDELLNYEERKVNLVSCTTPQKAESQDTPSNPMIKGTVFQMKSRWFYTLYYDTYKKMGIPWRDMIVENINSYGFGGLSKRRALLDYH